MSTAARPALLAFVFTMGVSSSTPAKTDAAPRPEKIQVDKVRLQALCLAAAMPEGDGTGAKDVGVLQEKADSSRKYPWIIYDTTILDEDPDEYLFALRMIATQAKLHIGEFSSICRPAYARERKLFPILTGVFTILKNDKKEILVAVGAGPNWKVVRLPGASAAAGRKRAVALAQEMLGAELSPAKSTPSKWSLFE